MAITRLPALGIEHPHLGAETVDMLDAKAVHPQLAGIDSEVNCVGIGASKTPTNLYSQGTWNLIDGIAAQRVERLVAISAEHWACQGSLELWIVPPLLQRQSTTTCAGWTSSSGRVARAGPLPALRLRPTAVKVGYRLSADEPLSTGG